MANLVNDQLTLEKTIVIDSRTAKAMEARGEILESDGYIDRDKGELMAAPLVKQHEVVDAQTAAKLAAQRGISLAPSVDAGANVHLGGNPILHPNSGNLGAHSNMPSAILESFRKTPPLVPTIEQTVPEFNPEFLSEVQAMNKRLNKVGGDPASRIPKNAQQPLMEQTAPATNIYAEMNPNVAYTQPRYTASSVQPVAGVDYSLISAIIKEAVREVMKDINIKEVVKEVLQEERENIVKKPISENIQITIGGSTFAGKISSVSAPAKK